MPQPEKLDDARMQRLTQAIKLGATYGLACKYAGISYQTLRNWTKKAESPRAAPRYLELRDAIDEAEGVAAVGWLAKIEKAANEGQWQAAAWKLERRFPHEYGRRINEHTGKDGEVLTIRVERADRPIDPFGQVE